MALIRTATHEDAAAISRVHVESWRTTYRGVVPDSFLASLNAEERTARWHASLDAGTRIFIAEQAGEVIGFTSGGAIREPLDEYDAELFAIYLLAEAQGKGIGIALLIELARRLDEDGFQNMMVWVLEANISARFYERSGATRILVKEMEIGGALLPVVAYGWPSLKTIINAEDLGYQRNLQ